MVVELLPCMVMPVSFMWMSVRMLSKDKQLPQWVPLDNRLARIFTLKFVLAEQETILFNIFVKNYECINFIIFYNCFIYILFIRGQKSSKYCFCFDSFFI